MPSTNRIAFAARCSYDRLINADDLLVILAHFGTTYSSSGWGPRADTNEDPTINADDFLIVLRNFATVHP